MCPPWERTISFHSDTQGCHFRARCSSLLRKRLHQKWVMSQFLSDCYAMGKEKRTIDLHVQWPNIMKAQRLSTMGIMIFRTVSVDSWDCWKLCTVPVTLLWLWSQDRGTPGTSQFCKAPKTEPIPHSWNQSGATDIQDVPVIPTKALHKCDLSCLLKGFCCCCCCFAIY